jgi:hypothetical protein
MGETDCLDQQCVLTTALGLGRQGSGEQKGLMKKYFPDDKVAKLVPGQDCYPQPASSTSFSNFLFLSIVSLKDTINVNYRLAVYNQGNREKSTRLRNRDHGVRKKGEIKREALF